MPCLIQIQFCLGFNGGKHISEKLAFIYNITLDAEHENLHRRMTFKDDENISKRLDLEKNKGLRCHLYQTYIHVCIFQYFKLYSSSKCVPKLSFSFL